MSQALSPPDLCATRPLQTNPLRKIRKIPRTG